MICLSWRRCLLGMIASVALGAPVAADPIAGGTTVLAGRAYQDIFLAADSPLNPTGADLLIPIFGDGAIILTRGDQVGDTISIVQLEGLYYGENAALGGKFVFGSIAPLTPADYGGVITNVVQVPGDTTGLPSSFVSGDVRLGGTQFGFEFLEGPLAGARLYTDPAQVFEFSSVFDGLPPSNGTFLVNSGDATLDVLLNGVKVAESRNRRILISTAVPEPTALALLGLGLVALAAGRAARNRRRSGSADAPARVPGDRE